MIEIIIKPSFKEILQRGYHDPLYFAREIYQKDLHTGQETWIANSTRKEFAFLVCGNRWGKGDTADIKGSWMAFYKPVTKEFKNRPVNILNTSVSQDQANIVLNKFEEHGTRKKFFSWIIKDIKYSPFPHILFRNGVTWWFRNASQEGRFLVGRSYLWINVDEADYVKGLKKLLDEILEPRTWDFAGYVDLMTTGKGKTNAYKIWSERKATNNPKYYFQTGSTLENKFIDQSKLQEKIKTMNPRLVMQNIKGQWVDAGSLISNEIIEKAGELADGLKQEPIQGETYINAWDLARRSTWCVGITVAIKPKIQIRSFERFKEFTDHRSPDYWHKVYFKIRERHKKWGGRTAIDRTGLGDPILEELQDIKPIGLDMGSSSGKGGRLKQDLITNGVTCMEQGLVGIPWIEQLTPDGTWTLQDELRDLEEDTTGLLWDGVCAMFIALWIIFQHKQIITPAPPKVVGVAGKTRF